MGISPPLWTTQPLDRAGPSFRRPSALNAYGAGLLDLALEVLTLDQVGDVILVLALLTLLHVLVALGELAEGGQGVGAELVQDAGDKLGQLLILAVSVNGEGVGGDSGVNCGRRVSTGGPLPNNTKGGRR